MILILNCNRKPKQLHFSYILNCMLQWFQCKIYKEECIRLNMVTLKLCSSWYNKTMKGYGILQNYALNIDNIFYVKNSQNKLQHRTCVLEFLVCGIIDYVHTSQKNTDKNYDYFHRQQGPKTTNVCGNCMSLQCDKMWDLKLIHVDLKSESLCKL